MGMLQDVIEELGSAIVNHKGGKVYVDGFYSSDRLKDWLDGLNCRFSQGLFDEEEVDYSRIQDNSLFVIKRDDQEICRYQYRPIFGGIVKYKMDNINRTRKFVIRRCEYSKQYNIAYFEGDSERVRAVIVCNDIDDLLKKFGKVFSNYKLYDKNNRRIENFPIFTEETLF